MNYYKLTTSDDEFRWINLDQVTRVTFATEAASGKPVLAIMFAGELHESRLTITGTTQKNVKAIESFVAALDAIAASRE